MCGRYATTRNSADLSAIFEALDETDGSLVPDYNVAPTDPVPIVRMSQRVEGRVLSLARWGLVPSWARDPRVGARMINARAETVAGSRAYGPSFACRRCLVPADGWFEWVRRDGTSGGGRQPYFMTSPDGSPLAFAGLWSVSGGTEDKRLTCGIITTAATGGLAAVHHRMPLLLPARRWEHWLSAPADDPDLLSATPESLVAALEIRPVSRAVGDVRNDGPGLIERVAVDDSAGVPGEPETLRLF